MPVRLIDPNQTTRVEVEGTVFRIRALNNGDKITLAQAFQGLRESPEAYNDALRIVAGYVKAVDGFEGVDPFEILVNMASFKSQQAIIEAVTKSASLTDIEAKNSDSSSGTPDLSPTGDGPDVDIASRAVASREELPSSLLD